MRPNKPDIYEPDCELNHGYQPEIVSFDVEYITLIAFIPSFRLAASTALHPFPSFPPFALPPHPSFFGELRRAAPPGTQTGGVSA